MRRRKAGLILMSFLLILNSVPAAAAEPGREISVHEQDGRVPGEEDKNISSDARDAESDSVKPAGQKREDEKMAGGKTVSQQPRDNGPDSQQAEDKKSDEADGNRSDSSDKPDGAVPGTDVSGAADMDGQDEAKAVDLDALSNYDLSSDQIMVRLKDARTEYVYTGSEIKPEIEVMSAGAGQAWSETQPWKLVDEENYIVEYKNNIDTGEASVIVTGKDEPGKDDPEKGESGKDDPDKDDPGKDNAVKTAAGDSETEQEDSRENGLEEALDSNDICTGIRTVKFDIVQADIAKCELKAPKSADYTGKKVKPEVELKYEGKKLVSGKDYKLTYTNNTKMGTAEIRIDGTGNFKGTRTAKFTIRFGTPALKVTPTYSAIKLKWQKVKDAAGYVIYRSTSPNSGFKKVKTYKSGSQTSYSDTGAKSGKTYYYKARAYKNVKVKKKTKKEYSVWSAVVSGKKQLETVKIKSAKCASETTAKLSWGKVTGAEGYEIYKCDKKNGTYTYVGKVSSGGTVSYTAKKLKMGVKYYFKVRAFRKSGSKMVYGEFSPAKAETFTDGQRLYFLFPNGIPTKKAEMEQYLVTITVPIKDINGVPSTKQLRVHKDLTKEFMGAFQDMYAIGFPVRAEDTDTYNWRSMASGKNRSHHSYGCVVDLNWSSNPMIGVTEGKYQPGVDPYSVTPEVVAIWKKHDFFWGGDWKSSKDYMHFTYTNH